MHAIHVKTHLTSDTVCLPELKSLIGKNVEITVVELEDFSEVMDRNNGAPSSGWFTRNFGSGWPDAVNDGFEDAVQRWRSEDKGREVPE